MSLIEADKLKPDRVKNGKPLDDEIDEIRAKIAEIVDDILRINNKHTAESGGKKE